MNRTLSLLFGGLCLLALPVSFAQDDAESNPPEMIGGFPEVDVLDDLQSWSFRQSRKVITDLANERMTAISLGVLKGESKGARFSIGGSDGLVAVAGGLTYECRDEADDTDGIFQPLTDDELEATCDWVIWQYSLDDAEAHLRDEVFQSLDKSALADLIGQKGFSSEDRFPKGRTDWRGAIDVYASVKDNAVKTEEHALKSCPSIDLVLAWFEGFKPTPVDIERYGEDVKHPPPKLTDKLYEAMIYSRVKGGFIEVRYSGYSGEPQDVAEFISAAIAQCALEKTE